MNDELSYRLARNNEEDFLRLYKIKCDPENIKWSGFATAPHIESFRKWYTQQIRQRLHIIYLVFLGNECIGFFQIIHKTDDTANSGHGILKEYSGRGLGTKIKQMELSEMKQMRYRYNESWVGVENIASEKSLLKIGFAPTEETEERTIYTENGAKKIVFRMMIKELQ